MWKRQLGSSGDDVRNLVTPQQKPTNTPFMSGTEDRVRKATEQEQFIEMSSDPYYKGVSRIPSGVTIKAEGTDEFYEYVAVLTPVM